MTVKGHFGDMSFRNEEHVIGNRRKGHPCYEVTKNLAELCSYSSVFQKVELAIDEIGYLPEAVSEQIVEDVPWLHLTAYSKTRAERNNLQTELLSKKASKA